MILSRHYNQRHIALYISLMIKKKYLKNLREKHTKKTYHVNYQTIMLIINKWPVSNQGGQHIYIPNEKRINILKKYQYNDFQPQIVALQKAYILLYSLGFFLFLEVGIEILRHSEHEHKEAGDVIMKQGETGDK